MIIKTLIILIGSLILNSCLMRGTTKTGFKKLKINNFKTGVLITLISIFFYWLTIFPTLDDNTEIFFFLDDKIEWLEYYNLNIVFGIDVISYFFILLTMLLIPICILANWKMLNDSKSELFIYLLVSLEFLLILVFSILDIFLFYIFFESVLIPMFFLIGIWGSRARRIKAAYYFFFYTLLGSLLMLIGIGSIYLETGSTNLFVLLNHSFSFERQLFLWLMFFIAFAVKTPIFPFHIWLPEAHVEAPTAGSVLLAGILLKLGGYGFIRYSLLLFPVGFSYYAPFVYTLCSLGVIYGSLTTLRQLDLKKIIAYSSIAHMNFGLLGLFSLNIQGFEGFIFLMLGHGLVSSALFLLVGMLYERYSTRILKYYGGLAQVMPIFSVIFLFFILANVGFPGLCNFIGEFLVLVGLMQQNIIATVLVSSSLVLSAMYSFFLYNRICFGTLQYNYISVFKDLTMYEIYAIFPLVIITIFLGVNANFILKFLHVFSYSIF